MKEPFLHIDTDTLLFDKIDFHKYGKDFLFSHCDMNMGETEETTYDLLKELFFQSQLPESVLSDVSVGQSHNWHLNFMNKTYTNLLFKNMDGIEPEVLRTLDLASIPNMNVVYVKDYESFSKASSQAINHYQKFKFNIDEFKNGPCYAEQLMIHSYLRANNPKYKKSSNNKTHVLFNKNPFIQLDQINNIANIDDVKFPFTCNHFVKAKRCDCCDTEIKSKYEEIKIRNKYDIHTFFNYKFDGFLHVTYLKWYDIFQAIIIHKLIQEVGEETVRKIHKYFKKIYPKLDLPIISNGEKLYTDLTGFSFE